MSNFSTVWQNEHTTEDRYAAILELADCQSVLDRLKPWQIIRVFRVTKRQDLAIKELLKCYAVDLQTAQAEQTLKNWRSERIKL